MAAKKSSTTTKASPKKAAVKKTVVKKKAGKVASETASKVGTPKATTKKAPVKKKAATPTPKKAAPKKASVKLNEKQLEILKKVHAAGNLGYEVGQKVEERTLEALLTRKLLKKGAKNKSTGKVPYSLTKTGEKHLSAPMAAPAQ